MIPLIGQGITVFFWKNSLRNGRMINSFYVRLQVRKFTFNNNFNYIPRGQTETIVAICHIIADF